MNTINVLLQASQVELSNGNIILEIFKSILFIIILIGVPVIIIRFIIKKIKKARKKSDFTHNQSNITEQLIKLKDLLDCGVITQQEYDDTKKKLLNI